MGAIAIRPAEPRDHAYLAGTIRDTLLINSHYCKGLHPATLEGLIEPVLATYQTLVATPPDEPDQILGFLVFRDSQTVAFVYVRSQMRSQPAGAGRKGGGIARALLARAGIARHKPGEACTCRGAWTRSHEQGCPLHVPEISCAFMVTKLDGHFGQAFSALAETKGYRLRFRPYIPMEITARLHYGRDDE